MWWIYNRERYLINSYFSFVFECYNISSVGHRSFLYLKFYFVEGHVHRVISFTTVTCSPLKIKSIKSINWWLIEHRRFSKNKWIPTQTYILDFGAPTTYKMHDSMPYSPGFLRLTGGFAHQQNLLEQRKLEYTQIVSSVVEKDKGCIRNAKSSLQ